MKRTCFVAVSLLVMMFAVSVSAQTPRPTPTATPARPTTAPQRPPASNAPLPETKMALINTAAFGAEKGGITKYVNAVRSVQREFESRQTDLNSLQARIRTLAEEITKLAGASVVSEETIKAKRDEGERLQRDLKYKKEQADADFEKRYNEVVGPISTEIGNALDQFATQRGITMVLDLSKMVPAILTMNPAMDVTQAFIAEYNSKHP